MGPSRQLLALPPAAPRWHWQHGPIDLVLVAEGEPQAVQQAHESAWTHFQTVLGDLVAELPRLRQPLPAKVGAQNPLQGPVARRMWAACAPLARPQPGWAGRFITPMAAVAGAVADELIAHYRRPGIQRAWINNGGDIALHLAPGAQVRVGLVSDLAGLDAACLAGWAAGRGRADGRFSVQAADPARGVATSGWAGRSCSLGVADSVTVLAASAAQADAAATLVANAVDLPHPGIQRRPACELHDDSDLGQIAVTVAVPRFSPTEADQALAAGLLVAQALQAQGRLWAAALVCQGRWMRLVPPSGQPAAMQPLAA